MRCDWSVDSLLFCKPNLSHKSRGRDGLSLLRGPEWRALIRFCQASKRLLSSILGEADRERRGARRPRIGSLCRPGWPLAKPVHLKMVLGLCQNLGVVLEKQAGCVFPDGQILDSFALQQGGDDDCPKVEDSCPGRCHRPLQRSVGKFSTYIDSASWRRCADREWNIYLI